MRPAPKLLISLAAPLAASWALALSASPAAAAEVWLCSYPGFGVNGDESISVEYEIADGKVRERSQTLNAQYDILENNDVGLVGARHYAQGDQRHQTVGAYTIALDKRDHTIVRTNTFTDTDDPAFRRGACVQREAP